MCNIEHYLNIDDFSVQLQKLKMINDNKDF